MQVFFKTNDLLFKKGGVAVGKIILVVDDDAADRGKLVTSLEGEGYTVVGVSGAEDAVAKAKEILPDLAIIDVVTPDSSTTGFDVFHKIKDALQSRSPKVLMVTGKAEGINISLARKMGADGFEAKTSGMPHVVKAVRDILSIENSRDAKI